MQSPRDANECLGLNSFLTVIEELARKSATRRYIYRGENKPYCLVSSSLYRRYKDLDDDGSGLAGIQEEILVSCNQS